jgi:hypothetical protein
MKPKISKRDKLIAAATGAAIAVNTTVGAVRSHTPLNWSIFSGLTAGALTFAGFLFFAK